MGTSRRRRGSWASAGTRSGTGSSAWRRKRRRDRRRRNGSASPQAESQHPAEPPWHGARDGEGLAEPSLLVEEREHRVAGGTREQRAEQLRDARGGVVQELEEEPVGHAVQ